MDKASQALVLELPPGMPDTFANRAAYFNVKLSTLYHRAAARRSKEEKNKQQEYLTPSEEKAFI